MRLTRNGTRTSSGLLEIFHKGVWGTVCDDYFDNAHARVVCRMLGLQGGKAHKGAELGQGAGVIWLRNIRCHGNESDLFDCTANHFGNHNCDHSEDVGVSCNDEHTG